MRVFLLFFLSLILYTTSPKAEENQPLCDTATKECLLKTLENTIPDITDQKWKDKSYREYAKILAANDKIDEAIALIEKISGPDTKAMTIRGIGMEASKLNWADNRYTNLFNRLYEEAQKIEHKPSHDIALTYIAMGQAESKQDDAAIQTALIIDNAALQHKALGEIAETQSMRKDHNKALNTLDKISSTAYKNKACRTVSELMANDNAFEAAFEAAQKIDNAYIKAESLLYIANRKNEKK